MTMHERLPSIPAAQADETSPFKPEIRPAEPEDVSQVQLLHQAVINEVFPDAAEAAHVAALYPETHWAERIARSLAGPLPPLRDAEAVAKRYPYGSYERSAYPQNPSPVRRTGLHVFQVACEHSRVIAFGTLDVHAENRLPYLSVYVAPVWRRRGLGRRLLNGLVHTAHRHGYSLVRMDVLEGAVGFFRHKSIGCRMVPGRRAKMQPRTETAGVQIYPMQLRIGPAPPRIVSAGDGI